MPILRRKFRQGGFTLGCYAALVSLLSLVSAQAALADDTAETVFWYTSDYPPSYITSGPLAGQGYQDRTLEFFAAEMPEFRIVRRELALARILANLEHGEAACTGAMARTPEREATMVFSKPLFKSLPLRLVVLVENADRLRAHLNDNGEVTEETLQLAGLDKYALTKGRFYGPAVEAMLRNSRHSAHGNSVMNTAQVLRMLARGRIDYTYAFPDEVAFYAKEVGAGTSGADMVTFPVAGTPPYVLSHFACTDSPIGRRFIAHVDEITERYSKNGGDLPWLAFYRDWLDVEARRQFEAAAGTAASGAGNQ